MLQLLNQLTLKTADQGFKVTMVYSYQNSEDKKTYFVHVCHHNITTIVSKTRGAVPKMEFIWIKKKDQ